MNFRKLSCYFIPSLADVIFLFIIILLTFYLGNSLLADGDTGYHIRAGEFIINTWSIPQHDMFSFHTPPISWTAHEWLAEVVMAIIHNTFGLTGIVIFFSLMIALIYYLMFRILLKNTANIYFVVVVSILAIAASQLHWLARPHIFSLLLMVVWYRILNDYQYFGINRLYWLPPLMVLWVNLHGGFITGLVLLGIYLLGNLLDSFRNDVDTRETARRKSRQILIISCVCLLASLINPYNYHALLFPFKVVSNKYLMDHVHEFFSPNFHETLVFKYLLLLTIALLACSRLRLNLIELGLILFFSNMALISVRYITLFAIIVPPIILKRVDDLIDAVGGRYATLFMHRAEGIAEIDAKSRGFFWPLAGVALVLIVAMQGFIEFKFNEKSMPVDAVEFLKKERIPGNMFNGDEFGDYIIYAAWPEYRVFFDGRSDMYGADRIKEYFKITNFESGWEQILGKYQIDWIIYEARSTLSRYLLATKDWRLIYADKVAYIFVRDIPKHQKLIDKYSDAKPLP